MNDISPTTVLARDPHVIFGNVDGEIMILDVDRGNYVHLNATASRLFELLEHPSTPEQLCTRLMQEYRVDAKTCRREVFAALSDFSARGLIRPGG